LRRCELPPEKETTPHCVFPTAELKAPDPLCWEMVGI
jgi:hypothetical protein